MSSKITIIGAGSVGATIAYTLSSQDIASEIVLIDINKQKAEGEVLDIIQGTCFRDPISIIAGDYEDAKDSDIVIITSGIARKPGQTRLELTPDRKQSGRYYDLCIYKDFRTSGEPDPWFRYHP